MPDLSPFLRTNPIVTLVSSGTYQVRPQDQIIQVQNNSTVQIVLPQQGSRGQTLNIEDVSGGSHIGVSGGNVSIPSWSNYGIAQIRWDELTQRWFPVQLPSPLATPPAAVIPPSGITPGTYQGITFNISGLATAAANMNYLTGNQVITLSGDVGGSGATAITTTLTTVNSNVGTFQGLTVNGKGLVTAAANMSYLTGNQPITLSGDISGSGTTAITTTLPNINTNVGIFVVQTVNAKGQVTAAANMTGDVTTLAGVATLATVNSNVGTFQGLTVNGKGLVTAAVAQTRASNTLISAAAVANNTTAFQMAGLGLTLTPTVSGRVAVMVCGSATNNTASTIVNANARWGTGTPPLANAAASGTLLSTTIQYNVITANAQSPFALSGIVSGLTLGTAAWFDVAFAAAGGGSATILNMTISAHEI